eukprot:6205655-Pleurochrysis_carterae.AAC.2
MGESHRSSLLFDDRHSSRLASAWLDKAWPQHSSHGTYSLSTTHCSGRHRQHAWCFMPDKLRSKASSQLGRGRASQPQRTWLRSTPLLTPPPRLVELKHFESPSGAS